MLASPKFVKHFFVKMASIIMRLDGLVLTLLLQSGEEKVNIKTYESDGT